MTVQNPPAWLADASIQHNADDVRRLFSTLFHDGEGVFESDGMEVTQKGGGADMSVDVNTGRCIVQGTEATYQGSYFCQNQGTTNLAIGAADATNPRIDLVVAQVRDSAYSGADDDWRLYVVPGTAAASPSEPAIPANSYVLARVDVAASASSITNGDITDRRDRVLVNKIEDFMLATGIDGAKITGTVASATTAGSATTATTATSAGKWTTARTLTVSGKMTGSVAFDGSGAIGLSLSANLAASDIPNLDASKVTTGTFATGRIPDLAASKITSGTLDNARIPTTMTGKVSIESDKFEADVNGTAGAPAFTWDSDTDLGFFRDSWSSGGTADGVMASARGEEVFAVWKSSGGAAGIAGSTNLQTVTGTVMHMVTTSRNGVSVKQFSFNSSFRDTKEGFEDFGLTDEEWDAVKPLSYIVKDHYVHEGKHFSQAGGDPIPEGAQLMRRAGFVYEDMAETNLHLVTEHGICWEAVAAASMAEIKSLRARLTAAGL